MHWSQQGSERGNRAGMHPVHATKKLLDRMKGPVEEPVLESMTRLGNWYTKPLFWRPQHALFVNERTFLPVLVPLAPSAMLLRRFLGVLATPTNFVDLTLLLHLDCGWDGIAVVNINSRWRIVDVS